MDSIDNKYISDAIEELTNLLGIKDTIPAETILEPLRADKIKECIEKIASYLGLPIAVNLSFSDSFESRHLARTDNSGRGVESITAQVRIPSYLPFYGSSALQGLPIEVKVSGNCKRFSEAFIAIMAHELSHIVLHSLWHREKDNEYYTDLTAMLLGFSEVIQRGRRVVQTRQNYSSMETTTTTFGYLSDEQFDFAFNRIKEILEENIASHNDLEEKILEKLTAYRRLLGSYRKDLFRFSKFIEYLDEHQSKRIRKEDIQKIIQFHQLDYAERFTAVMKSHEGRLKEIENLCTDLLKHAQHYAKSRSDSLRVFYEDLNALVSDFGRASNLLNNDIAILMRYAGLFHRLKINWQNRSM